MSPLLKYYPNGEVSSSLLQQCSQLLTAGGVLITPTDSCYAVLCDALNVKAVERIAHIKGFSLKQSHFSLFFDTMSHASQYVKIGDDAFSLIKACTPGPFTFILPTSSALPKVYKWRKEIGVRIPAHGLLYRLIDYHGTPLTGASLPHRYAGVELDEESLCHPELIYEQWHSLVDLVIDGDYQPMAATTVVDCTSDPPFIVRQGLGELRL